MGQLKEVEMELPQLVQCSVCRLEFCSACRNSWHKEHACQDNTFRPGETSSFYKSNGDTPIMLGVHREGQGLCSDDVQRAVVGIFAGFVLLLLLASLFLLLASSFILCCKCKCSKGDDDPLST